MSIKLGNVLVSLLGVILSAVISWVVVSYERKYNYHQLFAQTVSSNRMDWINVWRENISVFLSHAERLHEDLCKKQKNKTCKRAIYICTNITIADSDDNRKEMYEAKNRILSRLNMTERKHILLFDAINQLDIQSKEFYAQKEYIMTLVRLILKDEWERVKKEAKGKSK